MCITNIPSDDLFSLEPFLCMQSQWFVFSMPCFNDFFLLIFYLYRTPCHSSLDTFRNRGSLFCSSQSLNFSSSNRPSHRRAANTAAAAPSPSCNRYFKSLSFRIFNYKHPRIILCICIVSSCRHFFFKNKICILLASPTHPHRPPPPTPSRTSRTATRP